MEEHEHDGHDVQMAFGDHLEELRRRIIYAIIGIAVACALTLAYGDHIVLWLQVPLHRVQRHAGLPAMTFGFSVTTGLAIYMKTALIAAFILASPWCVFQLWRFVEVGLYPAERRVVLFLAPFSALMSALGVLFTYYVMLPVCLTFLLGFATSLPAPGDSGPSFMDRITTMVDQFARVDRARTESAAAPAPPSAADPRAATLPLLTTDPTHPQEGQVWINQQGNELKVHFNGITRTLPLGANSLLSPMIEIGQYMNFVLFMMLGTVVAFQLPIVLFLGAWVGLLGPDTLAPYHRHAVFVCFVLGAVLTPADPISMVVLALPLWVLLEVGLLMVRIVARRRDAELAAP